MGEAEERAPRAPRETTRSRPSIPVDITLQYRAPWRADDVQRPNVWNVAEDAGGIVVIAVARATDAARLVPIAVPVSRARRVGRRMLVTIGAGDDFAIESTLIEGLPRTRFVLLDAPIDVAQKLRSMP